MRKLIEVEFEFDPAKSRSNTEKHGIDFRSAQQLWEDPGVLILTSRYADESRFLAIGRIDGQDWTAIFTERETRIRIISVRRSRGEERALYDKNQ